MNEGHFDEAYLLGLKEILEPALLPRTKRGMDDARAKVEYLRRSKPARDLPDWEDMGPAQQALLQEAFAECRTEWQTEGRLNSHIQDMLDRFLHRAGEQTG